CFQPPHFSCLRCLIRPVPYSSPDTGRVGTLAPSAWVFVPVSRRDLQESSTQDVKFQLPPCATS
ncbi:hypothetical protein B0H10DRAFT_2436563, partial [Mycena sp. CBHHK59/15]